MTLIVSLFRFGSAKLLVICQDNGGSDFGGINSVSIEVISPLNTNMYPVDDVSPGKCSHGLSPKSNACSCSQQHSLGPWPCHSNLGHVGYPNPSVAFSVIPRPCSS